MTNPLSLRKTVRPAIRTAVPLLGLLALCAVESDDATGPEDATYAISVEALHGQVSLSPAKSSYDEGDVVTITATPAADYRFLGWQGDLSGTANPSSVTVTSDVSIRAAFGPACAYDDMAFDCFRILYPNGGETFCVGDTIRIHICSYNELCDFGQAPVTITLNDGRDWPVLGVAEDSIVTWVIPDSLRYAAEVRSTASTQCRIKVDKYNAEGQIFDQSDSSFTIDPRP